MARIRTIKPTFFFSEDIAAISIEARLLFIGLWCIADKQGRLEDRPKRIKAELYPYDQVDVDALLEELNKTRLINRYTTDNNGCTTDIIQVVNFSKHQRCHHTEQDSQLPEYKEGISKHRYITVKQPLDNGEHSEGKEGKGRERKGGGKEPRSLVSVFETPTIPQIHSEFVLNGLSEKMALLEANKFFSHFNSNGWKVGGKTKMKSWKSAVNSWYLKINDFKKPNGQTDQPVEVRDGN